jgi:hypothetical protein
MKSKTFTLSTDARSSRLPKLILAVPGGFLLGWDKQLNCLVDHMGVPLILPPKNVLHS